MGRSHETRSKKPKPMTIASIILCAGKGRRMQAPRTPKVCFPIAGKAAIVHMLERLEALGISPNILVVGHLAGTVVDEVGPKFPRLLFAYQPELLGTGHATKQGAAALAASGFEGGVLVVAGDKVVEPRTFEKLIRTFETESPEVALVVAPKQYWPEAGRIVADETGRIIGIVERADLSRRETDRQPVTIAGKEYAPRDIETRAQWVNQAVYLFRSEALFEALAHLSRDNVQKEEYLTDTIAHIVSHGGRVVAVPVDDREDVLGFNSPAELVAIEEHFRRKLGLVEAEPPALDPRVFKPPAQWAEMLAHPDGEVWTMLQRIYGADRSFCEEKRARLLKTVELFLERFGPAGVVSVIRAPGRVNLMGRHVDHRGGCVNLLAIDREHILVARRRRDTTVRACNTDAGAFGNVEFSIDDLLRQVRLDDWREFVNSDRVVQMVRDLEGDWGNYLKAPMLRLQQEFKDRQIHGVDCAVSGDIPMAAGLSSSSALVVAMAEALVLTNQLEVSPHDLVDLCGEGEWFVGTRGGSADHAAVKLSQFGQVAHVGFFPFAIKEYVPFPEGYALLVCNSRIQARKAAGARDAFNERVASYELAVRLVRKRFPNYAPFIQHLRDISPEGLRIRSADAYRILLDIPEEISIHTLRRELSPETVEQVTASHTMRDAYPLRGRLLYGIAECERSKHCIRFLRRGEMEQFGRLMNISHDGDRVVTAENKRFAVSVSDETLRARIEDLQSEDPARVAAGQLYAQPGSYACSIPEIDNMVDIALGIPGVLGAQLSGAGLGGCMMILARRETAATVVDVMNEHYYGPRNLEPGALIVTPIAGCSPLALGGKT